MIFREDTLDITIGRVIRHNITGVLYKVEKIKTSVKSEHGRQVRIIEWFEAVPITNERFSNMEEFTVVGDNF